MSNVTSVLIVGVGGQGTLLASRLLGKTMMDLGYDVKVSEVHGMSQRGGSVETYVRYGDRVYSPVIDPGEADVVLAFEQLEAARFLPFLKKGGTVITNTQKIDPMPVVAGVPRSIPRGCSRKSRPRARVSWLWMRFPLRSRPVPSKRSTWCSSAPWRKRLAQSRTSGSSPSKPPCRPNLWR